MSAQGLRLGSFAGAAIVVDPTYVFFAVYVLGTGALNGGVDGGLSALYFLIAIFIAVLVHEIGHAGVARAFKLPSKRIVLTFFGGHVEFETALKKRWQQIAVSLSGPLINLATYALLLTFAGALLQLPSPVVAVLDQLAYVSLILGVLNLLPGFPLDGGRALVSLLSYFFREEHARITAGVTGVLIALAIGAYSALHGLWWSLFIALFLALSAWAEIQRARAALKTQLAPPPEPTTSNA